MHGPRMTSFRNRFPLWWICNYPKMLRCALNRTSTYSYTHVSTLLSTLYIKYNV